MVSQRIVFLSAVAAAGLFASDRTCAQEWPRFRGPNGAGVSRATSVPVEWTERDFNWRVKLPGVGHSSPVLWGEKIFLTAGDEENGARRLVCLDARDGRIVWSREHETSKHRKHQLNSFASSTPAVDANRIYLCWSTPDEVLVQAFAHDGTSGWRTNLGPFNAGHGFGVSPILIDDLVIVGNEHEGESSLVALDNRTGKIRWRTPRESKVSYATPCVYQPAGQPASLIFCNWEQGITAIDPATGRINWSIAVFDDKHVETSIGSPIVAGDLVLGTCGWLGYATHTVAVRPDPSQPGKAIEAYRVDRGAPLTTTPLVKDDLLFLWGDNGIVTCTDASTGKLHWQKRVGGTYYGSPVAVGDAVYCLNTAGEAVVLAASKDYRLVARNPIGEASHSSPAVAGGTMYLRTFSHLISLGGKTSER
jgi:outer membrane protein assembly factor BamB